MDDQHCVQLGCGCTQAGLAFFRVPPSGPGGGGGGAVPSPRREAAPPNPLNPSVFLFLDHRTGRTQIQERQPGSPAPQALLDALRAAHPRLQEILGRRHAQLQQLGRRLMPKNPRRARRPFPYLWSDASAVEESVTPAPARTAAPKPGRNDPCPCGSGRKFKKMLRRRLSQPAPIENPQS